MPVVIGVLLVSCGNAQPSSEGLVADVATIDADRAGRPAIVDEILADGTVTHAEYERAVLAHMQCLEEHGIEHGTPFWDTESGYVPRWSYEVRVPPLDPGERDPSDFCWNDYEAEVAAQWSLQQTPSESEQQERERVVVNCLIEQGFDISDFGAARILLEGYPGTLMDHDYLVVTQCFSHGLNGSPLVLPDPE